MVVMRRGNLIGRIDILVVLVAAWLVMIISAMLSTINSGYYDDRIMMRRKAGGVD